MPTEIRARILNRPKPEGEPPKRKRRPRRRAQSETSHVSPTAPWKRPRPEGERGTSRHRAPQEKPVRTGVKLSEAAKHQAQKSTSDAVTDNYIYEKFHVKREHDQEEDVATDTLGGEESDATEPVVYQPKPTDLDHVVNSQVKFLSSTAPGWSHVTDGEHEWYFNEETLESSWHIPPEVFQAANAEEQQDDGQAQWGEKLCRQGCGRPSAPGYDTCCRTCAKYGPQYHGPKCEKRHKRNQASKEWFGSQ